MAGGAHTHGAVIVPHCGPHFLKKDRHCQVMAALVAGEIVSTGTLTRALPVKAGETWTTKLKGIALEGISLRFC
jgi:2-oxo-3-hexenedioate decarboxylase